MSAQNALITKNELPVDINLNDLLPSNFYRFFNIKLDVKLSLINIKYQLFWDNLIKLFENHDFDRMIEEIDLKFGDKFLLWSLIEEKNFANLINATFEDVAVYSFFIKCQLLKLTQSYEQFFFETDALLIYLNYYLRLKKLDSSIDQNSIIARTISAILLTLKASILSKEDIQGDATNYYLSALQSNLVDIIPLLNHLLGTYRISVKHELEIVNSLSKSNEFDWIKDLYNGKISRIMENQTVFCCEVASKFWLEHGKYALAEEAAELLLKKMPSNELAYIVLAESYYASHSLSETFSIAKLTDLQLRLNSYEVLTEEQNEASKLITALIHMCSNPKNIKQAMSILETITSTSEHLHRSVALYYNSCCLQSENYILFKKTINKVLYRAPYCPIARLQFKLFSDYKDNSNLSSDYIFSYEFDGDIKFLLVNRLDLAYALYMKAAHCYWQYVDKKEKTSLKIEKELCNLNFEQESNTSLLNCIVDRFTINKQYGKKWGDIYFCRAILKSWVCLHIMKCSSKTMPNGLTCYIYDLLLEQPLMTKAMSNMFDEYKVLFGLTEDCEKISVANATVKEIICTIKN